MSVLTKLKYKVGSFLSRFTFSPLDYWEERARNYGERSVLNIGLSDEEQSAVKDLQLKQIFPVLKQQLQGNERTLLDFGCGPGRLSIELAELTGCKVTAADPIQYLLDLGRVDDRVSYKAIKGNRIPSNDKEFDIIWISFVLGGITTRKNMKQTIQELNRVANDNCLLFLIENTTDSEDTLYWKYRPIAFYSELFKNFHLVHLGDFNHGNERFAILSGRKVSG